jgi:hypothetical protein
MSDIETLGNILLQNKQYLVWGQQEHQRENAILQETQRLWDLAIEKASNLLNTYVDGKNSDYGGGIVTFGPDVTCRLPDSTQTVLYLCGKYNLTEKASSRRDPFSEIRCMAQHSDPTLKQTELFRLSRKKISWGGNTTRTYDSLYKIGLVLDFMEGQLSAPPTPTAE